jgi:putative ABC transport system permease protein
MTAIRFARVARHSFKAVARHTLRSFFIMLGSLVGIGALTLVVAGGEAVQRKLLRSLRQLFGGDSIMVVTGGYRLLGGPRPDAARLTLDDVEALARELPQIEAWDPQQAMAGVAIRRGDAHATARVFGQSERAERVWRRSVGRGEYFDAGAVAASARVALLGPTVARELFGDEDPLGGEILVGSVPFRVVGVLEPFGTDIHGVDRDDEIIVPISTLMRRLMNVDTIGAANLVVADAGALEATAEDVRRILRQRHAIADGRPDDFRLLTPAAVERMVAGSRRILVVYLPLASGVALLVAAIVASTLMLASVSQRTGEIGLRRAVGARAADIQLQFVVETASTLLAGGLLGIGVGFLAAVLVAQRMHLEGVFSWKAIALGLVVAVATGVVAGILPARRAARLEPADSLR